MRDTNSEIDGNEPETGDSVVSYPRYYNPAIWLYLIFVVEFALLAFLPDRQGHPTLWTLVPSGVLAIPVLYAVLFKWRARIIADRKGIRWRGALHGWRFLRWEEIVDYRTAQTIFLQQTRSNFLRPLISEHEIVAPHQIVRFSSNWSEADALREAIRRGSLGAKVSDWEQLGTRRVDTWPRVFTYWSPLRNRNYLLVILGGLLLVALVTLMCAHFLKYVQPYLDLQQMWTVTGAVCLVIGSFLLVPAMPLLSLLSDWRRRHESITATLETLQYTNVATGEELTVLWSGVSDYFFSFHRGRAIYTLILSGSEEKQITWSRTLRDSEQLLAIVQRYAPRPANVIEGADTWRRWSTAEKMGGSDPATWQSGAVGVGGRVFTHRSLTNKIILAFLVSLVVWLGIGSVVALREGHPAGWLGMILTLLCFVPVLQEVLSVLFTRVETDEMGITYYSFLRKKHLYWYMIEDYRAKGKWVRSLEVSGREGTRLNIYSSIIGYNELKQEIERYAPSPKTGWEQTKETTGVEAVTAQGPLFPGVSEREESVATVSLGRDR